MSVWLAIDPGTRRLGVAAGNTATGIASPLTVVPAEPPHLALRRIADLLAEHGADGIVVGWPLNMDDSEGPQAREARVWAARLAEATGADVRMWDERLSSFTADQALAGLLTRKKRRARQDAIAAATILQDFLSCGGAASAPTPAELGPLDP